MRLRQRALRGTAATAAAASLVLALAGCVGGDANDGPTGPNGYDLVGTVGDVQVWHDISETTGTSDVILERTGDSQPLGVCLGGVGTFCVVGEWAAGPYVVYFAPPTTARVELGWFGQPTEMAAATEGIPADAPQIYVVQAAPAQPPQDATIAAYDAAGNVIAQ